MRLHSSYAVERYGSPASRPGGIAIGVAISIVLHVGLLYQSRFGWTPPAPVLPQQETITVWLRPAPVAPPIPQPLPPQRVPLTVQAEPPPPPKKNIRKERTARTPAPATNPEATPTSEAPGMTWVAPAPASEAPATPADPFAEPAQAEAAPKFDMDAARRSARKVANERDPAKAGTAVGQFPEKPLASETPLARKMSRAARADCKDGIPGGLLAPLLLAMDKKDHGCKW
ncbi:hypothetical protein ASD15_25175 [Massilia sp. Root351]|jgi:hypothetical protein|uniref:hypothetical protein n=1 Tax=Massilia sp. Root351 TaxID=1736522 RepID=UPI000708A6F9|nr:hypothetical protein [Massilia sp. Root351]KQV89980.1 hypothetical protein ASD15_25175 [Massilia sp. Root351]